MGISCRNVLVMQFTTPANAVRWNGRIAAAAKVARLLAGPSTFIATARIAFARHSLASIAAEAKDMTIAAALAALHAIGVAGYGIEVHDCTSPRALAIADQALSIRLLTIFGLPPIAV